MAILIFLLLLVPALVLALPALSDAISFLVAIGRKRERYAVTNANPTDRLLFLIPAHDEEDLIERCVRSLIAQQYPAALLRVVVVADNCSDSTANIARLAGATVLERTAPDIGGKGFAIQWALQQLDADSYDALCVIDADTIVEPDFSTQLSVFAPLQGRALQAYDGLSNEFDNQLTRLAGLLTRSRYDVALPLKQRAGLSCPLTGDGIVLGRDVLRAHPWRVDTITEGWELYSRLTLSGIRVSLAHAAKLYAQEARSMAQSASQRERWSAGKLAVLKASAAHIMAARRLGVRQRLDLIAELSSVGPVVRGALGGLATLICLIAQPAGWPLLTILFSTTVAQPALYGAIALVDHPQRAATLRAFAYLPRYALWRIWIAGRAILARPERWVRTARHLEE